MFFGTRTNFVETWPTLALLAMLGSQGIVVKVAATIVFRTVDGVRKLFVCKQDTTFLAVLGYKRE